MKNKNFSYMNVFGLHNNLESNLKHNLAINSSVVKEKYEINPNRNLKNCIFISNFF